jgi:hypothetical protein
MWTEHVEGTARVQHQPPRSDSRVIGTFSADDVRQDTPLTGAVVVSRGAGAPSARDQPRNARDRQSPRTVPTLAMPGPLLPGGPVCAGTPLHQHRSGTSQARGRSP